MNKLTVIIILVLMALANSTFGFVNYDEWEGDVSSDWNDADNWEGNSFPSSTQAARVGNSSFTYAPIISSNSSFTPRYVMVQGGSTLTIGANLSVDRDYYIGQGSQMIINSGNVSTGSNRDLNIRNEDTKVIVNGGTLTITDDLYLDRLLDIVPGADPTLEVNGGKVIIGGDMRFDGIFAEKPTLQVQGGTVDITGNLYNDGADVTVSITSDSLIVRGDLIMNGSGDSLLMTGGVLYLMSNGGTFTNDGIVDCEGGEVVFAEDYTLDGSGTTQFHNISILSTTGALDQSLSQMSISGGVLNDGTFNPNSNTVVLNGSTSQLLYGANEMDFFDLEINNSSSTGVYLFNDIRVLSGGSLDLQDGILNSDSTNSLTIEDAATSSSGSASSYVNGYMYKEGNDDFVFPLGNAGIWSRIELSNSTGSADTDVYGAQYLRSTHPQAFWDSLSYGGNPGGMYNVSILDYWKLDRISGAAQPFVKLYWESGDSTQIDDLTDLVVAHYSGSNTWENLGGTTSGTAATGSVETSARVNSFSPFTFGSSSSSVNPLPITLVDFSAVVTGDVVTVSWSTLSEINNDYFEIERSLDGKNFQIIGTVDGSSNSKTQVDYSFIDDQPIANRYTYYRLSQTDFDGTKTHSELDVVFIGREEKSIEPLVFPNPVNGVELFVYYPVAVESETHFAFFDQRGQLVSEGYVPPAEDGLLSISTPATKGLYILKIVKGKEVFTRKVLVQ